MQEPAGVTMPQEAFLLCQSPARDQPLTITTPVDTLSQKRLDLSWKGKARTSNHVLMPVRQMALQQASDEVRKVTQSREMFL